MVTKLTLGATPFELVLTGPLKGEETSKPKLIYRDKEQPNYGAAK